MALRPRLATGLPFSWSLTIITCTLAGRKIHRTEKNPRILSSDIHDCGARSLPALRPLVIEKSAALVYRDVLAPRAKNPTSLEGGYVAYEREGLLGGRGRPEVGRLEPAGKVLFVGVEA